MRSTHFVAAVGLSLLLLGAAPAAAQTADSAPASVAILHASVIDPRTGRVAPDQTVLVAGDRITAVGPSASMSAPAGATVVDATDRFLMPGLADMHVHFGTGGMVPRDSLTTERVLRQFVFYGVTTVLNLGATGGRIDEIVDARRRHTAGDIVAPTIYATGGLVTVPGSHPITTIMHLPEGADAATYWPARGVVVVATVDDIRNAVRRVAAAGMDGVKIVIESGPTAFGDDHPQMAPELVQAAVDEASEHGLPVFAHVSSPDELEIAVSAGVRALVHLVGPEPVESELIREMARRGVRYIPTLSLFIRADDWGEPAASLTDPFLRSGVDPNVIASLLGSALASTEPPTDADRARRTGILRVLRDARDAGVTIVSGTDVANPYVFPGYSMHHELELLVEAGFTPAEALRAATIDAAELIGRSDEFGAVAPGMRADLVLLDANPLDVIGNTRTIEAVMSGGRLYRRADLDRLAAPGEPK